MLKSLNLFRVLLALAVGWILLFYIHYGRQAWFFCDDFSFLEQYQHSAHLAQTLDFSSFGRPLSRNLYWYLGQQLFGRNAQLFFAFNLSVMLVSSIFSYFILRRVVRADLALVGAFAYLASSPAIHSYVWISNSQHSLAHLLVFGFVALYLRLSSRGLSSAGLALLLVVYLMGLAANIMAGLVVGLPMFFLLFSNKLRRSPRHILLVISMLCMFLFFWYSLRTSAVGAYELKVNMSTLRANAEFYFGRLWVLMLLSLCCLYGSYVHLRRGRLLPAWLFLAAVAFYLPFAFLVYQRYAQYIALPATFFAWGILCHIEVYLGNYAKRTALLIVVAVVATDGQALEYFRSHRWGSEQRSQVEQLAAADRDRPKRDATYCFTTKAHKNTTGLAAWDLPPEWWFVGLGKAFTVFVNPQATYQFGPAPRACDATFAIEGPALIPLADTPR